MAITQDELEQIAKQYVELLIIQYQDQEKARQHIESNALALLSNGILFDIRDAFDIETAVGVQLDILGKYIGIDRSGEQQTISTITQILDDDNYRFVLKLRIIQNNINHSESAIDTAVNNAFEGKLIPSGSDGDMLMTYIVDDDILTSAQIAFKKGVLPKPLAVSLGFLIKKPATQKFFGFSFGGTINDFIAGFEIDGDEGGKALLQEDLVFA